MLIIILFILVVGLAYWFTHRKPQDPIDALNDMHRAFMRMIKDFRRNGII